MTEWQFNPGMVYKLHEGNNPAGMLGLVLQTADTKADASKMMARYIISTGAIDRSREVVEPNGLLLDDHKKNPIVLCNHDRNAPVGLCRNPNGDYTVTKADNNRWYADFYFDQKSLIGQQAFDAVARGMLNGASIGFMPVPNMTLETKANDGYPVKCYKQVKLVEISVVPIPQNQDCIREMVYKGLSGKPLDASLMSILKPYADKPTVVTSGWETKGMDEKKYHYVKFNVGGEALKAAKAACDVVAKEDLGDGGCCDVPHVTVKYGINKDVDHEQIESLCKTFRAFSVKVGEIDFFANDDCDLLHFKIESCEPAMVGMPVIAGEQCRTSQLWLMNEALSALPHDDTWPEYNPHITIAYLKKGKGEYYKEMLKGDPGVGFVNVSEVVLATAKGDEFVIPLVGTKVADKIQPKTNRLCGWRVKAMQGLDGDSTADPTTNPQQAPEDPMMQPDETTDPQMKVGASFAHTLYQQLAQMIDLIDTGLQHQEEPNIVTMAKRLKAILGHAADKMHLHYDKYRAKHKDMPELPQMDMGSDSGDSEDDIFADDDVDDDKKPMDAEGKDTPSDVVDDDAVPDDGGDVDGGEVDTEGDLDGDGDADDLNDDSESEEDESDDDEDDSDDWDKKALTNYYRKSAAVVNGWWNSKTFQLNEKNIGPIREAKEFCTKIAANEKAGKKIRELATLHMKALGAALGEVVEGTEGLAMVTKAIETSSTTANDVDNATLELLLAKFNELGQKVSDNATLLASITGR